MSNPTKRWKISPMDLESRKHWADYSRAKDEMFAVTDTKQAPWFVVNAEDKKAARLNVIRHLLSMIPYKDLTPEPLELPPLVKSEYVRPPYPGAELHSRGLPVEAEDCRRAEGLGSVWAALCAWPGQATAIDAHK